MEGTEKLNKGTSEDRSRALSRLNTFREKKQKGGGER